MGIEDTREKNHSSNGSIDAIHVREGSNKGEICQHKSDVKDLTGSKFDRSIGDSKIDRDVTAHGGGLAADAKDLTGSRPNEVAGQSKIAGSTGRSGSDSTPGVESGLARSSSEAWSCPGSFHVVKDGSGHTTRLEGWLSLREGRRGSAEEAIQREARSAHGMQRGTDSGHILGYALGGPAAGECSRELAGANQLPMDARINRSYIAGMEGQLRRELQSGKQIYVQADVQYGSGDSRRPESVRYSFFEKGADGSKQPCSGIQSVETRIDLSPSETAGQAVRNVNAGQAKSFYSPGRSGASGIEWQDGH